MKTLALTLIAGLFGMGVLAQNLNEPTIVLVHGAWSDSSAWNRVLPTLNSKGFNVVTVNLPGHGNDNTPFPSISLKSYVDAIRNAIGDRKDIILVGHSMGVRVISQMAEDMAESIKKLNYITACLPGNGQSLLYIAKKDEVAM